MLSMFGVCQTFWRCRSILDQLSKGVCHEVKEQQSPNLHEVKGRYALGQELVEYFGIHGETDPMRLGPVISHD